MINFKNKISMLLTALIMLLCTYLHAQVGTFKMKKYLYLFNFIIAMIFCNDLYSQDGINKHNQINKLFIGGGGGGGFKEYIIGVSGTLVFKNNFGLSISYKMNGYKSNNLPKDYYPSSNVLGSGVSRPTDKNKFYSILFVKEFSTKFKKLIPGVELGPSVNNHTMYNFKSIIPSQGYFGYSSNYSLNTEEKKSIGLSVKIKTYYLISKNAAIELSAISNINRYQNFIGVEFNLLFGKFNKT